MKPRAQGGPGLNATQIGRLKAAYDPKVYKYPDKRGAFSPWCHIPSLILLSLYLSLCAYLLSQCNFYAGCALNRGLIRYWMEVRVSTDAVPGLGPCSVRWMDRLLLAGGTPTLYSYLFAHPVKSSSFPGEKSGDFAPHASEIEFVFGGVPGMALQEIVLSQQMCKYWIAFATTGDPNYNTDTIDLAAGQLPKWPKYTVDGDTVLRFEIAAEGGVHAQQNLRKPACDLQDKICDEQRGSGGGDGSLKTCMGPL